MAAATAAQVLAVSAAEKLLAVAIASMASPKALGHIAAALHRGCVGIHQAGDGVEQEVAARVALIQPVLQEQVAAGAGGRVPRISGSARAKRNVATHSHLGQGAEVLEEACLSPQKAQRGGRQLQKHDRKADEIKHKDFAGDAATHLLPEKKDQERQHLESRVAVLESGLKDLVGVLGTVKSDMREISSALAATSSPMRPTSSLASPPGSQGGKQADGMKEVERSLDKDGANHTKDGNNESSKMDYDNKMECHPEQDVSKCQDITAADKDDAWKQLCRRRRLALRQDPEEANRKDKAIATALLDWREFKLQQVFDAWRRDEVSCAAEHD